MTTVIAGYLINKPGGIEGARGVAYDYILASNGLFIRAEKLGPQGQPLIRATVMVAGHEVRGLAPLDTSLEFPQGRPWDLHWHAFLAVAKERANIEVYAAVVWRDGRYQFEMPDQQAGAAAVSYAIPRDIIVDMHSHGRIGAAFSSRDDADDKGFKVSVVVGHMDRLVYEVKTRVCVYGYHETVYLGDVFA